MRLVSSNKEKLSGYLEKLKDGVEFQIKSLETFNRLVCGFERKKLVVVGSRPSEGKSAFLLQLAYEMAEKHKVLYISLEMTIEEAIFRLLCHRSAINNVELYQGSIFQNKQKIDTFYEELDNMPRNLIITDNVGHTWEDLEKAIDVLGESPDIIMVDYIQCIHNNGKPLEAIEDYIKRIRESAIEKNMLVIVASQINRSSIADNKEPRMEGLQGSSKLEAHADKVVLLSYPCKHSSEDINKFKIIVAKNKNGMTGYVDVEFLPQYYLFRDKNQKPQPQPIKVDWDD